MIDLAYIRQTDTASLVAYSDVVKNGLNILKANLQVLDDLNKKGIVSDYNIKANVLVQEYEKGEQVIDTIDKVLKERLARIGFDINNQLVNDVLGSISVDLKKENRAVFERTQQAVKRP